MDHHHHRKSSLERYHPRRQDDGGLSDAMGQLRVEEGSQGQGYNVGRGRGQHRCLVQH